MVVTKLVSVSRSRYLAFHGGGERTERIIYDEGAVYVVVMRGEYKKKQERENNN